MDKSLKIKKRESKIEVYHQGHRAQQSYVKIVGKNIKNNAVKFHQDGYTDINGVLVQQDQEHSAEDYIYSYFISHQNSRVIAINP